jgi:hypothetical protein
VADRRVRTLAPSLAGGCLRYAVMDLLGFGRSLDGETRTRMAEGVRWHRRFQEALAQSGCLQAVEVVVRDGDLGVAGRIDAVVREPSGALAVVEYKTVTGSRFEEIRVTGRPPVAFWAQLTLYRDLTGYARGYLVIDARDTPRRRLRFVQDGPTPWSAWVRTRVEQARSWARAGRLPPREPAVHCLTCDRWRRCFRNEGERDAAVAAHPTWSPEPPLELPWPDAPIQEGETLDA